MINELLFMNGYGAYVLSAFSFTLLSFTVLYFVTKSQFVKEQKKFEESFLALTEEKYNVAINQEIYKEILKNSGAKI